MAETKYTFCRVCEAACGLAVEVENNTILRITPNKNHVSSKGFACIKGLTFHEIVHSPDRVRQPIKRTEKGWSPVSWDQALGEIGGKIRELIETFGKDSIALYAGNGSGFCLLHTMFAQGFAKALGTRNVYASSTQDCSNKFAVAERMYGFPMLQTIPDFENAEMFIIIGANPAVSKFSFKGVPGILRKLKDAEQRGCRIISINPRKTETVHSLGEHLPIRPDTDVFFLLALANHILARAGVFLSGGHTKNGVDNERVEKYMKNFKGFAAAVKPWTPERSEAVTGIPAAAVRDLAEAFTAAEGAALYGSTGINHGSHGTTAFWLIEAINAVTGNLDKKGGTLVGEGIINFPKLAVGSGAMGSTVRSRIGGLPAVSEALPGVILADEILTPGEGQVKALFVTAGNPALSIPDTKKMDKALEELELCVCIDIFPSRTANYADYILPGVTFMEHPDINYIFQSMLGITGTPHLSFSDTIIEPLETQKEETWIFVELCRASRLPFFGSKFLSFLIETERLLSKLPLIGKSIEMKSEKLFKWVLFASRIISLRKLKKKPDGILLPELAENTFLGKRVLTADGLVDLAPLDIVEQAGRLEEAYTREIENKHRFKMVNKRETVTHNSYFQNTASCITGKRNTNYLYIHPADALELGLRETDTARVFNEKGEIVLPVRITDEMAPKSVAVPWGWGHRDAEGLKTARAAGGANVNVLTPSGPGAADPISGMARLTGIVVDIEKV
jgi:anaerobic selenocysteine-containing dehydrogenase